MLNDINNVLLGAAAMGSVMAALFFVRFWHRTRDRLFAIFALAFIVEAVMRLILAVTDVPDEHAPFFYIGRLITFALIALAIIDKNRGGNAGA